MNVYPGQVQIDHASEHGVWTLLRRRPPAELVPFVLELEGYVETGGKPLVRRELPFAGVPMILVFDHQFSIEGPATRTLRRSFIAGLYDSFTLIGSEGRAFCMQVNFTPLGARRFLGIDMDELAQRTIDLDTVLGALAGRMEDGLAHASSWRQRFALLEGLLSERLLKSQPVNPLAEAAYRWLADTHGSIEIGSIASGLDISRKHLATLFKREVGMTPKSLARVMRFERANKMLRSDLITSLADLAAACGYADQPHLNREFRDMAGQNPSALFERTLADGTGIVA
jgi:AraC-like DNA-binding protein